MLKKTRIVAMIIMAVLCMTITTMAEIPGYEQVISEKGDSASLWKRDIGSGEILIDCNAFNASVSTDVNVRQFPGTDKPVVTVVGRECRIKVWGVTESGWAKVYCISKDGTPAFGFIKNTLLTEVQPEQPAKSQGDLQSEVEDSSQGKPADLQSSDAGASPEAES